ncbi:MFS transporter [Gordonia sp. PKS22-38]|uniref:MFS transporter n=1 Tax=Gordonia prachuapensis TaxID=3115651 RepID=A0ABU7MT42_9ACTN|nr:MFS transporter [Gordonia sp. PKS22-38]
MSTADPQYSTQDPTDPDRTPGDSTNSARTVQQYIDERPLWSDGTDTPHVPMTGMQWRIWWLAAAGKFFEGIMIFMTGVALPLLTIDFDLNTTQQGFVTSASLAGILVGATVLGSLADRYGRKRMFIVEMAVFAVFVAGTTFAPNLVFLVICLFGAGIALGCDYPTAHMVISESAPTVRRGRLVLSAFGFQSLGAFAGTFLGFLILYENPAVDAWRWMYGAVIIPAVLVLIGRFFVPDSAHWLMARGRTHEAESETERLLTREPAYPTNVTLRRGADDEVTTAASGSYLDLFRAKYRRVTIFASVPWVLQDLSTYGVGIFTPVLLATIIGQQSEVNDLHDVIHNDMLGAEGSALMDIVFVLGIVAAIFLVERFGRIRLQITGFIGCALGLFLVAIASLSPPDYSIPLLFAGFILFYFMNNLGPNSMTYLISGEVFPTEIRGKGAGFAASIAKVGAVAAAFFFPIVQDAIGTSTLLFILVGTALLGVVVTIRYGVETTGVSIESMSTADPQDSAASTASRV